LKLDLEHIKALDALDAGESEKLVITNAPCGSGSSSFSAVFDGKTRR
jgi:hypothetical protein